MFPYSNRHTDDLGAEGGLGSSLSAPPTLTHPTILLMHYEGCRLTRSDNAALAFPELLEGYDDPAADASGQGPEACLASPLGSHVCRPCMQGFLS